MKQSIEKKKQTRKSKETGKAIADVITMADEVIDENEPYEIFHPEYTWKRKTVDNFYAKKLEVPIFVKGECVYESPSVQDIQEYCREQIATLWDEMLRFEHPHKYYIDLSEKLWLAKDKLLKKYAQDFSKKRSVRKPSSSECIC